MRFAFFVGSLTILLTPLTFGQPAPSVTSPVTVTGRGCVEAGVEKGCLVLRDFKTKKVFNLFFKGTPATVHTAISFEGIENNNPNICMQSQAVDVTKWSQLKMLCPKPATNAQDSATK
jgi:hypothetical protein